MLRTLIFVPVLIALSVACSSSPAPKEPQAPEESQEPQSGTGQAERPTQPAPEPGVEPAAATCADLGGSCISKVATVACAEWQDTPDCGAGEGCCLGLSQREPSDTAPATSCYWKVGADCFDSAELACKAAGCTLDRCIQSKSLPVQVSCAP
jgi:hypothetical protein